jgi:hypothetical protein
MKKFAGINKCVELLQQRGLTYGDACFICYRAKGVLEHEKVR